VDYKRFKRLAVTLMVLMLYMMESNKCVNKSRELFPIIIGL